ncbi:MAG: preprotein translocase subunit SecE [bacterium]
MSSAIGVVAGIKNFFDEVVVELKKSSWPSRSELSESTVVIILTVIALGVFVATTDVIIEKMISVLVGASG